jgi:hypothetical protein
MSIFNEVSKGMTGIWLGKERRIDGKKTWVPKFDATTGMVRVPYLALLNDLIF